MNHSSTRGSIGGVKIGLTAALITILLAGCSGMPYHQDEFQAEVLAGQSSSQSGGGVLVTAAVPSEEQTEAIFGLPLYDRGIQPVWLQIENTTENFLRYAPTGSDRQYFSPLEVAYMHRKGYSKDGLRSMESYFYEHSMPRTIEPGVTASGFIFTNASPGTKNLYVDIFSPDDNDQSFAFFLDVPGFVPDHAEVDFSTLYAPEDILDFDDDSFRAMMKTQSCCTTNASGDKSGLPVTVMLVGEGRDLLRALLRAGWYETSWSADRENIDPENRHHLFGRITDTAFRIQRRQGTERNELRLWLAPWRLNDLPVWLAVITHFIGQATKLEQVFMGDRLDPEMDDGRNFLLQNLWYSQSLKQMAWLAGNGEVAVEEDMTDFRGVRYFTDGSRVVLWPTSTPQSLLDTHNAEWDSPPIPIRK